VVLLVLSFSQVDRPQVLFSLGRPCALLGGCRAIPRKPVLLFPRVTARKGRRLSNFSCCSPDVTRPPPFPQFGTNLGSPSSLPRPPHPLRVVIFFRVSSFPFLSVLFLSPPFFGVFWGVLGGPHPPPIRRRFPPDQWVGGSLGSCFATILFLVGRSLPCGLARACSSLNLSAAPPSFRNSRSSCAACFFAFLS